MKRLPLLLTMMVTLLALFAVPAGAQDEPAPDLSRFAGDPEFAAPAWPESVAWINVDAPLTWEALEGKVVLLDFWTYGCINCIHMIPVLERLEEKYAEELVIIGVHSAKFENEGETQNIQQIVQRYNVHHPVVNDNNFEVWNAYRPYGVQAWPTFVLVDPRGNIFAVQPGEIPFEAFDSVIGNMVTYFDTQNELNREPLALALEGANAPGRALNFPGKVLVDSDGGRLFIADSNNNRIVVADLATYEVLAIIGSDERGYIDGDINTAAFDRPQGMALAPNGSTLYIADTFNNVVRGVDLRDGSVFTVAGTGITGQTIPQAAVFPALETDLRSPWDLAFGEDPDVLYIAHAGTHQIWALTLSEGALRWAVGNGRESAQNGRLLESELAQPSGLYYNDGLLYFADSESSTIRVADFNEDEVRTVAGTDRNSLFDFGDGEGPVGESKLQHALGVTGDGAGRIFIADTYNNKIKVVDEDNITTTLAGGTEGYADGPLDEALFYEPGGLEYYDGKLYVADTNNHAVRVIDLDAGTVETVQFPNVSVLATGDGPTVIGAGRYSGEVETLEAQTVAAWEGEVVLTLNLPEGYKINDLAPSQVHLVGGGEALAVDTEAAIESAELRVPVTFSAGDGALLAEADVYFCEAVNETLCFIERFSVEVPLMVMEDAENSVIALERTLTVPQPGITGGIS